MVTPYLYVASVPIPEPENHPVLVIDPDECIDCGVCEPECPVGAIRSDEELTVPEEKWADVNERYSAIWPNITKSKEPLETADEYAEVSSEEKGKLFSAREGEGD